MRRRGACWAGMLGLTLIVLYLLVGCARPVEYQPIPGWLIPEKPAVATVRAEKLACVTDATYTALVERDRACWQYARELRALLGP